MSLLHFEAVRSEHPVDLIERLAALNEWPFDRDEEDEISITVAGSWTDYNVAFTWLEDLEALHVACAFDLKPPAARRPEVAALISLVNEQLWLGHFDLWPGEGLVMFRHAIVLSGGADLNGPQCQTVLTSAVRACERYYQAFQFVVWAGKSAPQAIETVMLETKGEA
ncbi:YbjN domain-containing protein [Methylocella sp.]|uniref:YbjN domain-containing protein n=1 Tax=Methylocella sp. TaxID=1978226 RepID=UPI003783B99E